MEGLSCKDQRKKQVEQVELRDAHAWYINDLGFTYYFWVKCIVNWF